VANKGANADRLIASVAGRQHGVISTRQPEAAGLSRPAIQKRLAAGRLHRLHRGVFAVGHTRLSFEGRCTAAVLALGEKAAISHQSAAAIWGILKPRSGPVHVTVAGNGGRKQRRGIRVHRSHSLVPAGVTRRNGIPVTKPKRTLQDLRRSAPQPVFRRAVRRALDVRLIASSDLRSADELTRSELERRFLVICRRHRLPQPEVNGRVGPYEVDFVWRERALIVETDGFRHHADRSAFEHDRVRDARLQSLGFRVLRLTHRQLVHDRSAVVAALRSRLGQRTLTPNL
jgi:very-short-patch-repair endonuclease